jgi:hypothetical protein
MDPSDSALPYLPTLDRARREGLPLPEGEPSEQQRVVVLIVHASVVRRRSWAEDAVLQHELMVSLPREAPPAPTGFVPGSHVQLEKELSIENCSACTATPGRRICRVCKGRGVLALGDLKCSCDNGYVACSVCGGEQRSRRVRVRYFNDEPLWFREAYVPTTIAHARALFSFESTFEQTIGLDAEPPQCLRCHDLSDRVSGTAYRGGEKRQRPEFRGHDFSDTIDKALAGLSALAAGAAVPLYDIRAYAWPILWLRYGEVGDVAVFTDRGGQLQRFGG